MAKYSNQVVYDIKTSLDASGITKLRSELNKLNQEVTTIGKTQWGLKDSEIQRTIAQVNRLQNAITECFNPKIGMLDLSKFNKTLEQEKALLGTINGDWAKMGAQGTRAINSLASSVLTLNKDAITMNSTLSKIANTFSNTVRWGITASIFQEMMSSVQGAVSYMKDLDESLTQIQMVTGSSKENMRELAQYANNAAQALGSTTTDYTNAVKVFVQEGFSESESKQYANLSTKLANVSEQNTATTSDQITAFRNAFQLDYEQTVAAMDKVANVANNTASNVNELMTASQRAASVAQAVGSSQDSFLAAIATIESVTRQSAEEIGNGLKTIYQRFADIKVGNSTEDGVDYGQYANALKSIGVDVLDAAGEFKGMDQILQETQEVWSSLSDTMKVAVGEKVAGKFQYNRFAALMNNQDYYEKALAATGEGSEGMMDQMNEIYTESIEGRLNTLQAAGEQIMSTLFNQDNIEPIIGAATDFLNVINKIIETVGGGLPVFTALSSILLRTFNAQIGEQVARITTNIQASMQAAANTKYMDSALGQVEQRVGKQGGQSGAITQIRDVLQGESFAGLTENTQEKVLNSAQELLDAENKVADVKDKQKLLQQQLNEELKNNSNLAQIVLKEEFKQWEIAEQNLTLEEEDLEIMKLSGNASKEEIQQQEIKVQALRTEVDLAEEKYDKALAQVRIGKELNSYTLEELVAIDEANAKQKIKTNYAEQYLQYIQEANVAEGELTASSDKMRGIKDQVDIEKQAAGITNLVSGLTSVAFLVQSITSLVNTLNDDSLSVSEKAGAVLSSLVMMLPMAITAYQSFVAAKAADVSITTLLTGATGALTAAVRGLGVAIASLPVIGQIALAITAIIAAIAALIVVFDNFILKTDNANKEYEKQVGLLKDLQSNYEELNSSVQELKQSMESLEQKRNALSELEEGTIEWKEAVLDLNEQVLSLLETYPKLAEYINSENGVLSISEEGLDTIYNEQMKKVQTAQNMVTVQQMRTRQSASDAALEDFANEHKWLSGGQGIDTDILRNVTDRLNDSSLTIEEACKNLGLNVEENGTDLRALAEKIQSNNVAIEKLNNTMNESLNYTNFASETDANELYEKAYNELGEKYGLAFKETNSLLTVLSTGVVGSTALKKAQEDTVNQDEFKKLAQEALQLEDAVISIKETNGGKDWVIKTATEEIQHSKEDLQKIMADYQATADQNNRTLEENKKIYEALGARWNEETQSFEGGFQLNKQQEQLIEDYQSNKKIQVEDELIGFADYMANQGYDSVDKFCKALADSEGKLFEFSENLGDIQTATSLSDLEYERSKQEEQGPLTSEQQTQYNDKLDELTQAASEAYDIDLEDIIDQAKAFREELGLTEGAARELAIQNQRMTKGIDALYEGWEKWLDVLQNSDHAAKDYIDASQEATKAIANLVGASDDLELSNEFFESAENLNDIAAAAEGDIEAINRLGVAVGKDLVEAMEAVSREASGLDFSDADTEQAYANMVNEFNDAKSIVISGLDELQSQINNLGIGQNVYDILGGEDWVNALNIMAEQTQMSVEQMNSLLNSIGVQADVTVKDVDTTVQVPKYKTIETVQMTSPPNPFTGEMGTYEKTSSTQYLGSESMPGKIPVAQINTGEDVGKPPTITYTGNGPVSRSSTPAGRNSGGSGGGKSSSPKSGSSKQPKNNETKKKQKSEWDYLTDITNDLERQSAIIEKLSKLEDRLYGANRVKQLKTLQAERQKNIKLLQQEEKIAKKHANKLRTDAKDENGNLTINGYAYRAGVSQLKFDGQGNLDNGRQIEQGLLAKVNQATKDYNKHRNDDNASYYNQKLDQAKSDYDGFLKAMSDYESTLGKIEDIQSEIQEQKQQIQDGADAIVDSIQEGLEDVLKAMDSQREFDRLYRNWQEGGNDYSHFGNDRMYYSEGLSSLLSPTMDGKSVFNTQLESLNNRVKDAEDVFDINKKDEKDENDEKLSQQAAFENLQEATEHVMDSLNKMVDYYDSLLETIEEASNKMDELIDNRLEQYDRLEDYLGTRLDQLILLFGDKSYEEQSEFYNQKIDVNMQKMVDINTAIKQKQATVDTLMKLEATNKELSSEERKQLQEAKDKVNELQKEQLNTETKLLQDIADKLKTQTSAEMNKLTKDLFNGADIGWLSEQWEIATRNSEKYLDDYNRAFELEKLQLKFQKALNDSQNTSLKTQQKIAALGDEYLTYLREKNKLSEYDVKHAEAQLNILQKQIALEEARDNKSQMQLQRNAAGNYDFVYAADQDAMNQAAEGLLAAQQESYNLSKQMYLDTYNSAYEAALKTRDMVVEIATDASISVEERSERIKFVLDGLNEYLQGSSVELNEISINLYNDFVGAEQLIAEENQGNLSAIFEQMRQETAALMAEINAGINTVKETGTTGLEDFQSTLSTASQGFEGTVSTTIGNVETMVSDSTVNTEGMVSTAVGNITNSIIGEGGFQEALSSAFNQIGEDGSNSFNTMVETITKESDDGHLQKIKVGTINTAEAISKYIDETALKKIDERFVLSRNAVLNQVDEINKKIEEAFEKICGKKDQIGGYLGDFKESSDKALKLAGDSYENFKDKSLKNVEDGLKDLQEETEKWQNDLIDLNQEIQNCASEVSYWKGQIDLAMASTQGLITESNKLQTQLGTLAAQAGTTSGKVDKLTSSAGYAAEAQYNASDAAYDLASNTEDVAGAASSAAGAASGAAGAYRDMAKAAREAAAAAKEAAAQMSAYNNSGFGGSNGGKFGYDNSSNGGDWYWDGYTYQYYGFATGGYTGTWSDHGIDDKSGKLAILHQKELVLNATDTENMLSAVKLVRDIMSGINSIPSLGKLSNQSNFNDTIEQRVEINATFPGVTEAIEIKQALEHLADNAYQVANRYKY